jgi:hypothetical protein
VVAPYDAEAVYVLASGKSETVGAVKQATWSGSSYQEGQPVWGGQTKYDFYKIDPYNEFWQSETLTCNRAVTPETYVFGSWFGTMRNMASPASAEDTTEAATTTTPPNYKLYTPHGEVDLPQDGLWPSLFPESLEEGDYTDQQPVKVLLSYSGDGMYYSEEGTPVSLGGYGALPGVASFFIGGA